LPEEDGSRSERYKVDDNKKSRGGKISYIFTRETMGMTLILFCAIVFLMLLTGNAVFAGVGTAVCTFMYGTFGYGSWLVLGMLAYLGEWLVFEKKIKIRFKKAFAVSFTVFMLFLLFHAVTSRNMSLEGYGSYIGECYVSAQNGWAGYTFGGVVSAIFVYPIAKVTTFVGAYVIFSLLAVGCGVLTYFVFKNRTSAKESGSTESVAVPEETVTAESTEEPSYVQPEYSEKPAPVAVQLVAEEERDKNADKFSSENLGRKILFENGEFAAESYRRNMIFNENSYFNRSSATIASEADYLSSFSSGTPKPAVPAESYSESYQDEVLISPAVSAPASYIRDEKPVENLEGFDLKDDTAENYAGSEERYERDIREYSEPPSENIDYGETEADDSVQDDAYTLNTGSYRSDFPRDNRTEERGSSFGEREENYESFIRPEGEKREEPEKEEKPEEKPSFDTTAPLRGDRRTEKTVRSNSQLFDDDEKDDDILGISNPHIGRLASEPRGLNPAEGREVIRRTDFSEKPSEKPIERQVEKPEEKPVEQPEEKPRHVWKKYVRPSLDLLDDYPENTNVNTGEIEDNKRIIVETLERFKIASDIANVTIGPAITRYDVIIEDKTNIKRSLNYRDAIAMELRKDNVTAYLNYSKGALSIEVPNSRRTIVGLKGLLASQKFINSKKGSLTFALGKNVEGDAVCPDITKMPHLLVAGTTGSGKSICLSALLVSLLYKYGPEELRLILVDPKQVEFISYDKLPHLMINEILYEVDKAIKALNWAIKEMERRYSLFKEMTEKGIATKNLDEYNAHLQEGEEKLPKVVIVLDEFGDLMLQAKKDIESRIIKLVQKARACGIHLILATQRPSVDCITGLIKSNLPTRIGFKVNSFDDARTIFDIGGAEKLLGKGDMYFRSAENPELARIQGCFVDTHEVQKVTDFIKANNETYFDQSVSDFINTVEKEEPANNLGGGEEEGVADTKIDDTFIKALQYCVASNQASVSMIQRRFPVGYIKACKIIDWMENMNYITQSEGSKPRKVLLTKEEFINIYGEDIDD